MNEGAIRRVAAAFRMVAEFGGDYSWRVTRPDSGGFYEVEITHAEQNIIELTIDGRTITQTMRSGDAESVAFRFVEAIEREVFPASIAS